MRDMVTTNPVVAKALNAVALNLWSGNPYKCPYCGSTNGWTYDGICKSSRCGRKLNPHDMAQRINELVKRKILVNNPQDLKNIARISGVPVDILRGKLGRTSEMEHGSGGLKLRQKHSGLLGPEKFRRRDTSKIGFTLTKGIEGGTAEYGKKERGVSDRDTSVVHGSYLAYLSKYGKGRKRLTTHYKSGDKAREADELRKWARGM